MLGQRGRSDVELLKEFNVRIGIAVEGVIWGLSESQGGEHLQQKQAKE